MKARPEEPRCPFCYHYIEQPKELQQRKMLEFPVGACENCRAVYVYDATGHNMGAAFIEALLFACNYDDYLAFSLSYGEDYTDSVIGNYDIVTHTIVPGKTYNDRFVRGVLIFIKIVDQFQEVTEEKVKERLKASQPFSKKKLRSENFSKEKVRSYLLDNRQEELIALAGEDSRVLNELQRMLYTPDEDLRWRIIDMVSKVCKKIGETRPDIISKFISQLIQNTSTSGSSAWGALETAGSIISINPDLYGEFSPAILSFLNYKDYRKEVTLAIGIIAGAEPELVKYARRPLCSFLNDLDPVLRGYAAWALGNLGYNDSVDELIKLEKDDHKLSIWREGKLREITVAQLAKEAVEKLTR